MSEHDKSAQAATAGLLTRREFLRRVGLLAGATSACGFLNDLQAMAQPGKPVHVVIVGAGLAGLCAAFELEKRGHVVTILEADPRHIGGRVRTLRFEDGLYGEAGAMRIPLRHDLTRHYIKEFGLPLRRFVQSNPEAYYFIRGEKVLIRNTRELNRLFSLRDAERQKSPDDLWAGAVTRRVSALTDREKADLFAETPRTDAVKKLDQESLRELCGVAGLSDEATELLMLTSGEESLMHSAITEDVREEVLQLWSEEFHEIVGGNDRLPASFAERLRSKPRLGCEVVRFEQDSGRRCAAIYRDARDMGRLQRVEGDFVLCTLPFPVLNRLTVDPPFSGGKQRSIRQLNYDSATKVLAVTGRRFWEADEGIFGGGTYTDLPSGITYYPSDNAALRNPLVSSGPGVLLASYTWGQAARRLAALPDRERAELVIAHLGRVHPQLLRAGMVRQTASWNWDTHRWSGGAFAWFMPGQHATLHRDAISPEGRIIFAGEHTTLNHAWMQGALESAVRAVREMLVG